MRTEQEVQKLLDQIAYSGKKMNGRQTVYANALMWVLEIVDKVVV